MKHVAAIGECMIEMQPAGDGTYRQSCGGDTLNMAWYLGRIGKAHEIEASYVTALGQDRFSRAMLEYWQTSGLDTSTVATTEKRNAGLYFADTDKDGNRDYTFFRDNSAARIFFQLPESAEILEKIQSYDLVYASAISLMILSNDDRQKLIALFKKLRAKGVKTVFDTNYRAAGWGKEEAAAWMTNMMMQSDIVLPTNDENQTVFGDETPLATLERIKALGAKEIIVKCGKKNALIWESGMEKHGEIPPRPAIKAVDTTAAGDSFNAAYLCGRLLGKTMQESALWGHKLAAEVIQHRGALIPLEKIPAL
ncbi:MAG: sugar kinase [Alphaproteobacteria bacterium]|nr:sugar kinase [Alphaproteobacteria bacterium]